MSNLSLQELLFIFKIISYFLGVIGIIIVFFLGGFSYFYIYDRKQNSEDHKDLSKKSDDNGIDIAKIKGKLKL